MDGPVAVAKMTNAENRQFSIARFQRLLDISVIVAAVATVPIIVLQTSGQTSPSVVAIDWVLWAVFAVDLVVNIAYGRGPRLHRILDVVIVVTSFPLLPDLLSATRLTRLMRLFRVIRVVAVIGRALPALRTTVGRTGFLYVAGLALFVVVSGAGILTIVEPETAGFWSAIWWALVTTTTVGYGDIAPVSLPGRVIAVMLMFSGISLIAVLSASIAAHFVGSDSDQRLQGIEMRLERIEKALNAERTNRK